ncbi:MAG: TlpA family protein disulfide reductase, partial [Lachnospiraceae bacterium]|nr:TlpA family protein disulfide reductase [Lachnospiraceae bacterium]
EYKDEVVVIAVNCMEDENTVSDFIKDNGYTFPVAFDVKGKICQKYPSDGIPYTLVIDKEGVIRKIYLGAGDAEEQYEEYKKAIEDVLGE